MRLKCLLTLLFCLFLGANIAAQATQWPITIKDAHSASVYPLQTDASGNLYACVTTGVHNSPHTSVTTAKYSPSGALLWSKTLSQANQNLVAAWMTLDSAGNIYVLAGNVNQLVLAKYSANGKQLWSLAYPKQNQILAQLALDSANNPMVLGTKFDANGNTLLLLIKFSANGGTGPMWTLNYLGRGETEDYGGYSALDANGNLYVPLTWTNTSFESGTALLKISPAGKVLWRCALDTSPNQDGATVQLDSTGAPYVQRQTDQMNVLTRVSPGGAKDWEVSYPQIPPDTASYTIFYIDKHDAIVTVGTTKSTTNNTVNLFALKYDVNGNRIAAKTYPITKGFTGFGSANVDANSNLYITGSAQSSTETDALVFKLDTNMKLPWTIIYGKGSKINSSYDLLSTDKSNHVYVFGGTVGKAGSKALALSYDSNTGAQNWQKLFLPTTKWTCNYYWGVPDQKGGAYVLARGSLYNTANQETQASVVLDLAHG